MKQIQFLMFLLLLSGSAFGQSAKNSQAFQNFPKEADPVMVGAKVSDRFLQRPHSNTGFWYTAEQIKKGGLFNNPVGYIVYPDVCAWYGALSYAKLANNVELTNRLIKRAGLVLGEEASLVPKANHVDNNVFGIVPLEVYLQNNDRRFYDLGIRMADEQFKVLSDAEYAKLTSDEKTWYSMGLSWNTRFWIDDMYMITMIQMQAYRATKDPKYMNRAAKEMVDYLDKLQTANGLFHHAPDVPIYWGRGNGWMAAGMAELLRDMPETNIYKKSILAGYKKMMATLLQHQGEDGMWRQIVDDPKAWNETSCTGMFTFSLITGVKNGWLDAKRYAPAARKGWISLCSYINSVGDVTDICEGTNKKNDYQYYLARAKRTGDLHGQAPILWCASALLR